MTLSIKEYRAKSDAYLDVLRLLDTELEDIEKYLATHECAKGNECMQDCSELVMRNVGRKYAYNNIIHKVEKLGQQIDRQQFGYDNGKG